jgi:hypothetical protein
VHLLVLQAVGLLLAWLLGLHGAEHLTGLALDALSDTLAPVTRLASGFFLLALLVLFLALTTEILVARQGAEGLLCGADSLVVGPRWRRWRG